MAGRVDLIDPRSLVPANRRRRGEPPRVVVIGGGACGMAAAWELAERGARVTVIEREPRLGGLCATHAIDGYRFDLGGHRFISRSGELVARVRALLGEELLRRERRSVILHGGRSYAYPLAAEDLARALPPRVAARALASFASARLDRLRADLGGARLADHTFEDWVVARFGRHLYDLFFGPYTEKLWGIPSSQLSSDWARERISLLDLGDAILRAARLRTAARPRGYARGYYYPRLGIGRIFEAIGERIGGLGADVLLGVEVVSLGRDARGRVGTVRLRDAADPAAPVRELDCDFVISTASLGHVARWLAPTDDAVARHASALRYRAVRFLNVPLARPRFTDNTWMYVSEPRYLATRVQEPRHRSPDMAPPGRTSLMFEIPCDVGDAVWRAADDELLDRCARDLDSLGFPGVQKDAITARSTFVDQGYPIYALGYAEHQRALLAAVGTSENVLSVGRQGTFRYVFMDIAMEMGFAAARQILDGALSQAAFGSFRSDRELIEAQSVTA